MDAQQFVCSPIAAGETASSLARRLTGSAAAAYGHTFQIRDPARRMFVPKSHYQRLQSDWQACIAPGPVASTPVAYAPVVELASAPIIDEATIAPPLQVLDSTPVSLARADLSFPTVPDTAPIWAAVLSIALLAAAAGSLARRPIPPDVRRAGENFVTVFARPLIDTSSGVPPIHARFRFRRRKQQLEIFMAPAPGHRYPNLSDHKKNLEYDVDRVIGVLGSHVLSKPLRAHGKWVVVTISEQGVRGQTSLE